MTVQEDETKKTGEEEKVETEDDKQQDQDTEQEVAVDFGEPEVWRKYKTFDLEVDPDQDYKAKEIKLCNFSRPHMRAFHCSWWNFFVAFFIWFAIAPLLSEIKDTLGLSKQQIWTANIVGVGSTIMMRFILGPMCDKYGARKLFSLVLCLASIPTALTGTIQSAAGLAILRMFIGLAGGTFVMCQYWSSRMFTRDIVGTANALVGGWGNLGGGEYVSSCVKNSFPMLDVECAVSQASFKTIFTGVTQLVMGSALFPLFKIFFDDRDDPAEMAWRTVCIVPAVVAMASGLAVLFIADDAPTGNYTDLKMNGAMPEVSAAASFRSGAFNFNTWLLFIQYGCSFGVELTMNNAAALYFKDEFGQSTESAAAIASIFGWMNLFARGIGGYTSDYLNGKLGMRGRLITQVVLLAAEGALVFVFANTDSLGGAIAVMVFFSLCVQAAEGSTYGIVPYVDPPSTGSIAGIVGAGGNTGAVCFGLGFRQLNYYDAFILMGSCILGSSVLTALIFVKGHSGLFCGRESPHITKAAQQTLAVPEPAKDTAEEIEA